MDDLTHIPQVTFNLFGINLVINTETVFLTWIVIALMLVIGFFSTKNISIIPNPFQVFGELLANAFYGLTKGALDEDMVPKYFPLVFTLFLFIWLSNLIGVIPHLEEPTADLNTTLGLGLMGFFIAHYAGIREKGFKEYSKEYFEPIFFMAPLNVIGELAKVISISFRLYGNMVGGAIILLVISHLTYSLVFPPLLMLFFNIFIGTIQAFVFTMLTLIYISVQVK